MPAPATGRLERAASSLLIASAFLLVAPLIAATDAGAAPRLTASTSQSSDGVYQLSWEFGGPAVLEESSSADFGDARVVYRGQDQATTLTGRSDGTYTYRLRTGDGSIPSEPVQVDVEHHPLGRALAFFAVGLFVFAGTIVVVVRGAASEGKDAVGASTGSAHG